MVCCTNKNKNKISSTHTIHTLRQSSMSPHGKHKYFARFVFVPNKIFSYFDLRQIKIKSIEVAHTASIFCVLFFKTLYNKITEYDQCNLQKKFRSICDITKTIFISRIVCLLFGSRNFLLFLVQKKNRFIDIQWLISPV